MKNIRKLKLYIPLIIIVVIMGLCSRRFQYALPELIGLYAGDILWGLMVFFITGVFLRKKSTLTVAIAALLFSIFIETSQLYHSPWIDALRGTRLGGLILGYGFLWSDIFCYTVGIIIGVLLETALRKIKFSSHNPYKFSKKLK